LTFAGSIGLTFPEQLWQPRDVNGDPSRLVVREHLRLSGISLGLPTVEICERLTGGVPDDIAAGQPSSAVRALSTTRKKAPGGRPGARRYT
jgi:hypothetical protein